MSNDSYELRFSAQMLPAVLHGLAIERNCAMMSGRTGAMMQAEFQAMLDGLARQCGIPNLLRVVDEHKWYRACDALKKAKEFHWYVQEGGRDWSKPDRPQKPGNLSLVVDGREYPLEHSLSEAEPHIGAIREMIEMYAAVNAVKGPDERGWKSCQDTLKARREEAVPEADTAEADEAGSPGPFHPR